MEVFIFKNRENFNQANITIMALPLLRVWAMAIACLMTQILLYSKVQISLIVLLFFLFT